MPPFLINEGRFEVADGWEDRSVTLLTFPPGSPKPDATFTVTRETMNPNASLGSYIDQQLVKLASTCPQFQLLRRADVSLGGMPSYLLEYTWRTPDLGAIHQLQAVLVAGAKAVALTATASADKFPAFAATFQSLLQSFRPSFMK
jgi:hypothetical protein